MPQPIIEEITISHYRHYLAPRPRDMHKGQAGHVLVVGGQPGHSGAALMSAMAALRVGAGLVTIATHPNHAHVLNINYPEIMSSAVRFSYQLETLVEKATVIVVGPGLGQSAWSRRLFQVIIKSNKPLIVDADGLTLLAKTAYKKNHWIHAASGEAACLLATTTEKVQADRCTAVMAIQEKYDGVAVLKGAGTLIALPNEPLARCLLGNPGMATGGMGDVLTGVIGALVAQGIPLAAAAKLGVVLHARAADLAAKEGGERGLIATDLLPYLRQLVNQ